MDDGVFSNKINHSLAVGVGDSVGIRGVGHYLRMHCTIRNGSIGTALYRMAVIMSHSLTVSAMVGVGSVKLE